MVNRQGEFFFVVIVQIYFLLIILTKTPNLIGGQVVHFCLTTYNQREYKRPRLPTSLSRIQIGMHLKAIGLACGIRQPLSFYVGRHSFGTLTLEAGVPIESIAKMMGHASIASRQIYAQITDSKISKDMDKLIQQRKV